jgi:hypothetical protein
MVCLVGGVMMTFVSIGSFLAGLASLLLAIILLIYTDKRERSLIPNARAIADQSHAILKRMIKDVGDSNIWVKEYKSFNHTLICTLGAMSRKFAKTWVDEQETEDAKAQWRRIFGLKKSIFYQ